MLWCSWRPQLPSTRHLGPSCQFSQVTIAFGSKLLFRPALTLIARQKELSGPPDAVICSGRSKSQTIRKGKYSTREFSVANANLKCNFLKLASPKSLAFGLASKDVFVLGILNRLLRCLENSGCHWVLYMTQPCQSELSPWVAVSKRHWGVCKQKGHLFSKAESPWLVAIENSFNNCRRGHDGGVIDIR